MNISILVLSHSLAAVHLVNRWLPTRRVHDGCHGAANDTGGYSTAMSLFVGIRRFRQQRHTPVRGSGHHRHLPWYLLTCTSGKVLHGLPRYQPLVLSYITQGYTMIR